MLRLRPRGHFPIEFRQRATALAREIGSASAGCKLGIAPGTLESWIKREDQGMSSRYGKKKTAEETRAIQDQAEIRKLKREIEELKLANEVLKAVSTVFFQGPPSFQFEGVLKLSSHRFNLPKGKKVSLKTLCHILGVSRTSYYAWLKRPPGVRQKSNEELVEKLKKAHVESRGTYGAPRLTKALQAKGDTCGHNRVARLMRRAGIFGCQKRKSRWVPLTTDSSHGMLASPRHFKVETPETHPKAPNQVWVSDTTYVATREGWLYLTIQLDVFTRKIVGYDFSDNLKSEAVWESLRGAIKRQPGALSSDSSELLVHSDRGRQYTSELYRGGLKRLGIRQSMSRSGNCYDNAYAETFFHTLKVELIHRREPFGTRAQGEQVIGEYIEQWYNRARLHSGLNYQAPNDYERQSLAA